jgi:hypothetical protein
MVTQEVCCIEIIFAELNSTNTACFAAFTRFPTPIKLNLVVNLILKAIKPKVSGIFGN